MINWLWCGGAKHWGGGSKKQRWGLSPFAPLPFNHCLHPHILRLWPVWRNSVNLLFFKVPM